MMTHTVCGDEPEVTFNITVEVEDADEAKWFASRFEGHPEVVAIFVDADAAEVTLRMTCAGPGANDVAAWQEAVKERTLRFAFATE